MTKKLTAVLIALSLLSITTGCNNTKETGSLVYTNTLFKAAHQTQKAYSKTTKKGVIWSGDIPRKFWSEQICELKPQRVYFHKSHMVIALKTNGNVEEGITFDTQITSHLLLNGDDGFTLGERSGFASKYKRTIKK